MPSDDVKISPGCTICAEAVLQGDISIGAGTVIHPRAHIVAESGPIHIGENNLIEENAVIANRQPTGMGDSAAGMPHTMTIGGFNVFEVGCRVESSRVGDHNVVESKAVVGPYVELTSGCMVGAGCVLETREILPENSVIYGRACLRRMNIEKPPQQFAQLEHLKKVLPNYHHLVGKK